MDAVAGPEQKLTPKGLATRERIVAAAADLMYEQGVHLTNNESVRAAAGVSGSQLGRHFPTKQSLVRAVVAYRAERVVGAAGDPAPAAMDSIAALRAWARSY